ncbi:hypothetical protein [Actinoplanes utahensis]|nr:hypothetical protein [Actinoplanes utahensis]GIF31032.1 hypothetical protein Aut01nite_40180 [Actinoplanes utahensis]
MDQREWDYGTRMSRSRRAAGSWPTREPEAEDPEPRWSSLTDTGSMAPSDEALAWQRRADDWAQQSEVEPYNGGGQAIEPANRWSTEVTSTGRPTFPADGVGWRTETAEWRATGARWRQTTEWRSATGSHVWRSTTEAWQGDDENPAKNDKPAISGTAWPTPESSGDESSVPSWRQSASTSQPATASWEQPATASREQPATASWEQPATASREQPATGSWGQPASTSREQSAAPSWEQPAPSWRRSEPETPSWRRDDPDTSSSWRLRSDGPSATTPVEQTRSGGTSWQQPSSSRTPSWQEPSGPARPEPSAPARPEPATPSWQQPSAQTPSWQESAGQTPSWQQPSASTPSWQQPQPSWQQSPAQPPGTPSRSRRRGEDTGSWSSAAAADTAWPDKPAGNDTWSDKPAGGTWSGKSAAGSGGTWTDRAASSDAGRSDRAAPRESASWSDRPEPGQNTSWSDRPAPGESSGWSDRPAPGENTGGLTRWERTDAPGWQRSPAEDARHLVREDDRAAWRRDAGYSERPTRAGRRRAAEGGTAPSGGSGWSGGSDSDNWAGHTDTGNIFADPDPRPEAPTWAARSEAPSRRDRRRYAEESRPEPAGPYRPEPARADLSRPDLSRSDLVRPEPPRTDSARPDRAQPGAVRPDQTGSSPTRQGPGQGGRRPRYNANATNWREDTASWDAEQDTSNWTRDPDTGQWSRAEDDPRVLAWRAEAARREAGRGGQATEGEEDTGWRLRPDDPIGGVPGGPLPSSSVPADNGSPGWPTSAVPNTPASGGKPPGVQPRSSLPGPVSPADERQGRRRRTEEDPYQTGGRRRRSADPAPDPDGLSSTQSWQLPPEPRQSRQYRRLEVEPEEYPAGTDRPGPRPPQWQDPSAPQPVRPQPPQWQEPRRPAYRDEPSADAPGWQDPSGYGQPRPPQQQPRSGFGSAARELPAGPSAQQPRAPYGGPARELPAGPAAQQRPAYGGPARALPAGPSAYDDSTTPTSAPSWQRPGSGPESSWPEPQRPASEPAAWLDQERRTGPQRPSTDPSWLDQERGRQGAQRPVSGPGWLDQERQQQAPQRSTYGDPGADPSWLDQQRQRQVPPAPGGEPSWLEQERQQRPPQGSTYGAGSARVPTQPSGSGYGSARALPAGGAAPTSGPAWSEQQVPARGGSEDLSARWPDPLADQSGRRGYGDRDDPPPPAGGGFGDRPPLADWLATERAGRRGADYRGGAGQDGETDWRRELSRQSDLAEGESRRYDTSDFPPFRPSGSAAVNGSSNLALSATSVISTKTAAAPRPESEAGEDTSWPPRRSTGAFQGTGSYERRPVSGDLFAANRPSDLLDPGDDEEEEQTSSPLAAVGYTVVWYGVPVVLFVAGMFVLNSGQRTHALDTLADAAPEFAISLALSMLVAFVLRSATTAWKSASVGLAAAVVGGGLATVLSSAITGNSLS